MLTGKVKSFDEQKGWGFIQVPNEGEIFVHYHGIEGTHRRVLTAGQDVSLVIVQGKRGPQAAHVRVLD
ncbi:cold-shock protein [Limosilactobacillus sp.]|jgi:CspA family cold shock protein|uniref:cold-shock protein n=1 Tax=Limosilactobacillus sp. TaxID=2773925 RepID=UPI0025BE7FE4|nr:cold shock domain-containing protein [Limosilactobacillus sp.]MCH3922510.1 cold shock domain-containing protein [Limosilactobacillus sp.]MCH3927192.1 cold shock domain-containing protein [Limosilactobacillus sp.]